MKAKGYLKYILWIPVVIAIGFLLFQFSGTTAADILAFTPESLMLAALVLLCVFCLKTVVMVIPMVALYISAGVIFPIGWAFVVTCAGLFLEMTLGYIIGRRFGSKRMAARIEKYPKLKKILAHQSITGLTGCFMLRLMLIPFDIVSMFLGASGIRFPRYVLFTFLGSAPGMIPFVLMGDAVSNPLSREFLIPFSISAAVSICGFLLYRRYQKNKEIA